MILAEQLEAIEATKKLLVSLRPCTSCKYYCIIDPVWGKPVGAGECAYDLTCSTGIENRPYGGCTDLHSEWEPEAVLEVERLYKPKAV